MSTEARLNAKALAAMKAVRPILAPRKSAAVAALLYSEQVEAPWDAWQSIDKAIAYLQRERDDVVALYEQEKSS